jgi:hypothetical protein
MENWFYGIEALHYFTVHDTLSGRCRPSSVAGTACGIPKARLRQRKIMTTCTEKHHPNHPHRHGPNCGHTAIRHDGHVDYLHDGHLHHAHEDHVDEHVIAVDSTNPMHCTPQFRCSHAHGPNCGHEAIPHGDHVDYLVNGRMHYPHGDHCDDHGPVELA